MKKYLALIAKTGVMVDVYRFIGPLCLTSPNICLYVGNKLITDETQFEENVLFEILYKWSKSPTVNNVGTITDTFWLSKAWMKVYEKHNSITHVADDEPSLLFTDSIKNLLSKFDNNKRVNDLLQDETVNNITKLKETYRKIVEQI